MHSQDTARVRLTRRGEFVVNALAVAAVVAAVVVLALLDWMVAQ